MAQLQSEQQARPPARQAAPSLQEVRQSRRVLERVERAKAEFRISLEGLVPDLEVDVRVSFRPRPGLTEMRALGAEYRLQAIGSGDPPCECSSWESWAKAVVTAHGGSVQGPFRPAVDSLLGRLERKSEEASAATGRALKVAEAAQEAARHERASADGAGHDRLEVLSLLRRCQCGSPEAPPDPTYVADRDKALGRILR